MWRQAGGCVIIRVTGKSPERLLNRLNGAGISVWDVHAPRRGEMTLMLRARDFPKLRPLRRDCGCEIHIEKRIGLPFRLLQLRFRKTLAAGLLAALALLVAASTRIWVIEVTGCSNVPEETVLRYLAEQGIRVGAPWPEGPLYELVRRIHAGDERIAWIGVYLDGVLCRAEIVESVPLEPTLDQSVPTDVVAVKGGVISYIAPYNGKASVAVGDEVKPGDILIRGDITREDAEERLLVHAHGLVMARIYYFSEAAALPTVTEPADSGRTAPYRRVSIAGQTTYESIPPYDAWELRDVRAAGPFGTLLPIRIETGTFYERIENTRQRTPEEMAEAALTEAGSRAYDQVPKSAAIVDKTVSVTQRDGVTIGVVCIVAEESIGYTKEITN